VINIEFTPGNYDFEMCVCALLLFAAATLLVGLLVPVALDRPIILFQGTGMRIWLLYFLSGALRAPPTGLPLRGMHSVTMINNIDGASVSVRNQDINSNSPATTTTIHTVPAVPTVAAQHALQIPQQHQYVELSPLGTDGSNSIVDQGQLHQTRQQYGADRQQQQYGLQDIPILMAEYGRQARLHELYPYFPRWIEVLKASKYAHMNQNIQSQNNDITYADRIEWTTSQLAMMLSGFRHVDISRSAQTLEFIDGLARLFNYTKQALAPTEMAHAMIGLSSSTCEDNSVKRLVESLTANFAMSKEALSSRVLSNIMFGLRNLDSGYEEVRKLVDVIALRASEGGDSLNDPICIASCLFGLQRLNSDAREVRDLVKALTKRMNQQSALDTDEHLSSAFSAQSVCNALYGLQGLSSDHSEVAELLSAFSHHLAHKCSASTRLTIGSVAAGLYGLQRCSGLQGPVLQLLRVLSDKIDKSTTMKAPLQGAQLSMALYGLQGLSSEYREVRNLLHKINDAGCDESSISTDDSSSIKPVTIANALLGLQNMNADHEEVRRTLAIVKKRLFLSPQVKEQAFNAHFIAKSMRGLKKMDSKHSEVRDVVSILATKMIECKYILNGDDVAQCLIGLKCMSDDHEEVRQFMRAVSNRLESGGCYRPVRGQHVGMALFGLKNMSSDCAEVRQLMASIYKHMIPQFVDGRRSSRSSKANTFISEINYYSDSSHMYRSNNVNQAERDYSTSCSSHCMETIAVGNAICGLHHKSVNHPEVAAIVKILTDQLSMCRFEFTSNLLADAVHSLQHLTVYGDSDGITTGLLVQLTHHMRKCRGKLSASKLLYAAQGLKHLLYESDEVQDMIAALQAKLIVQRHSNNYAKGVPSTGDCNIDDIELYSGINESSFDSFANNVLSSIN
jgi:hypothetical protein